MLLGRKATAENSLPNGNAVNKWLTEYRYEHDLITAEEAEQYLARRHVQLTDLKEHLIRMNLCQRVGTVKDSSVSISGLGWPLYCTGILGGHFNAFAERLARYVACATVDSLATTHTDDMPDQCLRCAEYWNELAEIFCSSPEAVSVERPLSLFGSRISIEHTARIV